MLGIIAGVILGECLGLVSIELGALAGCVIVCAAGVLKPKEAYDAIEWPVLFIIFGIQKNLCCETFKGSPRRRRKIRRLCH